MGEQLPQFRSSGKRVRAPLFLTRFTSITMFSLVSTVQEHTSIQTADPEGNK